MPSARRLSDLRTVVEGVQHGPGDPEITDVTHRSDHAEAGSLFVAIAGERADGHDYVGDAVDRGAAAVCVERPVEAAVPVLRVPDTRMALGPLASAVHGYPSSVIDLIGVTGTNGKTTITHFVESIARRGGQKTGLIGTIQVKIGDQASETARTTPEASDFQRLLARMRDSGVTIVAAEVSSHALDLGRVRGTKFNVAAFTNLSRDHLDFHGSMEAYGEAKRSLFRDYDVDVAVLNIDDPLGADIAANSGGEVVTVGLIGDVNYSDLQLVSRGIRFAFTSPWGSRTVEAPVAGEFNVANLVMAATCCLASGMDFDDVVDAMATVEQVPGRFEVVSGDDPVLVIVDYAHTPESIQRAIQVGRSLTQGQVIALVGAGGDRDTAKRPLMGAALSAADIAIVTSDNPRSENPQVIVDAVAAGVTGAELIIEVDRRRAITAAIARAADGDLVLVLGRGHEPEQHLASSTIAFDDRQVAAEALHAARKSADLGLESGSMGT